MQNVTNKACKLGFTPENKTNRKIQAENKIYGDKNLKIDSIEDV